MKKKVACSLCAMLSSLLPDLKLISLRLCDFGYPQDCCFHYNTLFKAPKSIVGALLRPPKHGRPILPMKIVGWGWYYLCTVLDDFSRYIIVWRLAPTLTSEDTKATLDLAVERTAVSRIKIDLRPRLLSDNSAAFVSDELAKYLDHYHLRLIRGAPYHPQTQGKIERFHRSMKSIVKLENFYFPWALEQAMPVLWITTTNIVTTNRSTT